MPRLIDHRFRARLQGLLASIAMLIALACSGGGGGGGGGGGTGAGSGGRAADCGSAGCQLLAELPDGAADGDMALETADEFGTAVATDGDVLVVGVRLDDLVDEANNNANRANAGSAFVYRSNGTDWDQEQKLVADDLRFATTDFFGSSVAIDDDVIVVSARLDDFRVDNQFPTPDILLQDSGSVFVFRFNGGVWSQEQQFSPAEDAFDDGEEVDDFESDEFGFSVAVEGDVLVAGAVFADTPADAGSLFEGAAWVYRFDGSEWVQEQQLFASDGADQDYFGGSVAISGDVIVVGARFDDDAGSRSGSAYVFRFDGDAWVEEQKLVASDAAEEDGFGISVSIDGDVIVVGSIFDDDGAEDSGSAYVFGFDGGEWLEDQKLVASDGAENDQFGGAVSISDDVILIGSALDDDGGTDSGSVYVFVQDGDWEEDEKLVAPDASESDEFGFSVAVSGETRVVGTPLADGLSEVQVEMDTVVMVQEGSGSAYAFD